MKIIYTQIITIGCAVTIALISFGSCSKTNENGSADQKSGSMQSVLTDSSQKVSALAVQPAVKKPAQPSPVPIAPATVVRTQKTSDTISAVSSGNKGQSGADTSAIRIGYICPNDETADIALNGPKSSGWHGILFDVYEYNKNWDSAKAQNYYPKIASLNRDVAVRGSIDTLKMQIDRAASLHADWVYLDDGLTGGYIDHGVITAATIDSIHAYLRSRYPTMKLAVAEDCYTIFENANRLEEHWKDFYSDNVDIIMPYGYDRTTAELDSLYAWTTRHGKPVVPVLAYHVFKGPREGYHPDGWYFQLSGQTGGEPFLETALKYAYKKIVFYYYEGDTPGSLAEGQHYLRGLTSSLQMDKYLKGKILR